MSTDRERGSRRRLGAAAVDLGLVIWRRLRPRHFLVLDIGDRRLTGGSAPTARELAGRIQYTLASGELSRETPTLP